LGIVLAAADNVSMSLDEDLDLLYQRPLQEFTGARNDLVKRAGARAGGIKALPKPPIAAWAVNQLYWQHRGAYDALIEAAEALRAAHTAVLSGKRGDLRFTGKEHEEALEQALKRTLAILAGSGHPVTDATRHAVAQTLRALPADDPPGRLSRALTPGGFEMLAGITVKGGGAGARAARASAPALSGKTGKTKATPVEERRRAQARDEAAAVAKALREAEQEARRAEFEAARATRAAARADELLADARASLDAARTRLQEAEADAGAAGRKKKDAESMLAAATHEVAAARRRADTTTKDVKKQTP
jgi:hypothetical protein